MQARAAEGAAAGGAAGPGAAADGRPAAALEPLPAVSRRSTWALPLAASPSGASAPRATSASTNGPCVAQTHCTATRIAHTHTARRVWCLPTSRPSTAWCVHCLSTAPPSGGPCDYNLFTHIAHTHWMAPCVPYASTLCAHCSPTHWVARSLQPSAAHTPRTQCSTH